MDCDFDWSEVDTDDAICVCAPPSTDQTCTHEKRCWTQLGEAETAKSPEWMDDKDTACSAKL